MTRGRNTETKEVEATKEKKKRQAWGKTSNERIKREEKATERSTMHKKGRTAVRDKKKQNKEKKG